MLTEKRLPALPILPLPRRTASTSKISLSYLTTQEVLGDISPRADELGNSPRSRQLSSNLSLPNFVTFPAQPTRKGPSIPEYPHEIPLSELGRGISDRSPINGPRGSNPREYRRMRPTQVAGDMKDSRYEAERGIVFQHREAGDDRELPPPYMDSHSRR